MDFLRLSFSQDNLAQIWASSYNISDLKTYKFYNDYDLYKYINYKELLCEIIYN